MKNNNNAFTEVYEILNYLNEDDYKKIPDDVIEIIRTNRNAEYHFQFDLKECNILNETKTILFVLLKEYLLPPKQKKILVDIQNAERMIIESKKKEKYDIDVFRNERLILESKTLSSETNLENRQLQTIETKENIFTKIWKKIRNLFHK